MMSEVSEATPTDTAEMGKPDDFKDPLDESTDPDKMDEELDEDLDTNIASDDDNAEDTDSDEDGDSYDDLAEAAKNELLKYTIIDNGIEIKPAENVINVEAIQKAAHTIGKKATFYSQGNSVTLYKCTACYEIFKTETELSQHTLEHVDAELCNTCGRVFDSNRALLIHKAYCTKSGSKLAKEESGQFNCTRCDRTFNFKSTLVNHRRTVHYERSYECTLCHKGFPTSHDLARHSYTHSSFRPYKCDKPGCSKAFTCTSSLNKHKRLKHDVDKVYRCTTCSKTFNMECDIQRHMFTHTSIRPFKCTICSKTYTCKSSLKQHINLIHGTSKLSCVFCSKGFKTRMDLDRHTATHTGSKPWRCSVCLKSYTCKSSLSVHKRNIHGLLHVNEDEKLTEEDLLNEKIKDEMVMMVNENEILTAHETLDPSDEEDLQKNVLGSKSPILSQLEDGQKMRKKRGRKPKTPQKMQTSLNIKPERDGTSNP